MAAIVDAGAWFAGRRQHYCGVIESISANHSCVSVLQDRYTRSRDSARLQSATRGPAAPARGQWGAIRWPDTAAVLCDCSEAASLPPIESALARHALEWLLRAGIHPETGDAAMRRISG
jgi:hypothetical protein